MGQTMNNMLVFFNSISILVIYLDKNTSGFEAFSWMLPNTFYIVFVSTIVIWITSGSIKDELG